MSADEEPQRIDFSELSGTEFQKLIFERLVEKLFTDPRVLSVENHAQGAVDYVVREREQAGMIDTPRMHYFECKNYARALELDNVAKVMVVAVADQPSSVHVVSRTRLQPQIKQYAARLFHVDTDGSPIFRSVVFRHWQTDELGDFTRTNFDLSPAAPPDAFRLWWWISECSAFSEREIASTDAPQQDLTVSHGALLLVSMELSEPVAGKLNLMGLPPNSWSRVRTDPSTSRQASFLISSGLLAVGCRYSPSIRLATGGAGEVRFPLGRLTVSRADRILPELRSAATASLTQQLGPNGRHRLVLVDGEAGVGKTHLIECVAEALRALAGFDLIRFTITSENCGSLMGTLLRGCLTPPFKPTSFQVLAEKIQMVLLQDIGDRTIETDINLFARIAARMGPRVVVLRDCQYITATVADQLWALIVALDDAGWGDIRIVLEYRQPDASRNTSLASLAQNIRLKVRNVLVESHVEPLNASDCLALWERLFERITDELGQCLVQRTGGLPLFIDSHLRRLLNLGHITRNDSATRLTITRPAQVRADTLPAAAPLILQERIRGWLLEEFAVERDLWAVELGLAALAEDATEQALLRTYIGLQADRFQRLHVAMDRGGIGYGRPDEQIVFRHDLLRVAVISVAVETKGFGARAAAVSTALQSEFDGSNNLLARAIRIKIFDTCRDNVALETELRLGIKLASAASDYGRLMVFLGRILELLKHRADPAERFDLMNSLAWAAWVSDSLRVARGHYLQLAAEAENYSGGDFSLTEAVATDAYRRAIGIDLELAEPRTFLENAIRVLHRRQTPETFNSILNRLVLFCARFGFPRQGYDFASLAFKYIGDGSRANEGAVLCSEVGALYAPSDPDAAAVLFFAGVPLATGDCQRIYNVLDLEILRTLHQGHPLDLEAFSRLWSDCSRNRLWENATRAALLRGSLALRDADLVQAQLWVARTATFVRLYQFKEFELSITNDQILLALLSDDLATARAHLRDMEAEYGRVVSQLSEAGPLVDHAYAASLEAAARMSLEPSSLPRPSSPPEFCAPLAELNDNIAVFAEILGSDDFARPYRALPWGVLPSSPNPRRQIEVAGYRLTLGAY